MKIVVTGAAGFVGRVLVEKLLSCDLAVEQVTVVDLAFDRNNWTDSRVRVVAGSIASSSVLEAALDGPIDAVFHLASVPGGAAERDYEMGRSINLDATLMIIEALRAQATPSRLVFASSVAIYGDSLPNRVDDATPLQPALTYGAHKLIGEILVADASRRGWIDGISLRLPGVVARPLTNSGLLSAYMSEVFWRLSSGQTFTCPVSPSATAWWISVVRCVDNLIHAARLDATRLSRSRVYSMPVLRLSMAEIVDALVARYGVDRHLVKYQPDERIERIFGRYPPIDTQASEALGFRHDGSIESLIAAATAY